MKNWPVLSNGYREITDVEHYVTKLLSRVPSHRNVGMKGLEELDELPLGEREELLETIRIVTDNLSAHVHELQNLSSAMQNRPRLRLMKEGGLMHSDIQLCDVISVWEHPKRVYYYIVGKWPSEQVVLGMLLTTKLQIDKRILKGYNPWSHKIGPLKLKRGRIERRGLSVEEVGATPELIERWKLLGYKGLASKSITNSTDQEKND